MSVRTLTIRLSPGEEGQISQAYKVLSLESLINDPGPLMDSDLNLFTNDFVPTPDSITTDFELPTWTGYAAVALATNPATPAGAFGATVEYNSVDWQSAANADCTIYGAFIPAPSGTGVRAYGVFDEPIPVEGIQTITIVVVLLWE